MNEKKNKTPGKSMENEELRTQNNLTLFVIVFFSHCARHPAVLYNYNGFGRYKIQLCVLSFHDHTMYPYDDKMALNAVLMQMCRIQLLVGPKIVEVNDTLVPVFV